MECQRLREAMYRITDNELDAELLPPFHQHLTLCPPCDHHYAYVSKLISMVRCRCSRYAAPSTLRIRILASFPHRDGVVLEPLE